MPFNAAQRQHGQTGDNATPTVKLWDGHRRLAIEWTGQHREPKLWTTKGDCLVYLYGKGHCNAGASFRIDFGALIRKRCYTFLEKYIDWQGRNSDLPKTDDDWNRWCPKRMVSLYVPAAPGSTRSEIVQQHLSIRNFLAWVTGLPLVGTHLGGEIMALFRNMTIYRSLDADSTTDLLAYLEGAGYLDIVAQPNHALAVLYVAESLRQRDLYTRAFVHCVGMGERMYQSSEYTKISLVSRKLIRTANQDLKTRLDGSMEGLGSFLDEELSESRLGLPRSVRAHLERFRSALSAFYTAKFGYFPPRDFDAKAVQAMSEDFEALYDLLVDDGTGTPGMVGGNNGGGLCMLQIIRTFDSWNSFETRQHPLPLLPTASEVRKTRRMPWLGRGETGKPSNRLVAHTALIKASNWRETSFKNGLVRMYRDFEGNSLDPSANKLDKSEKVSITDARKVRWILIYAMCQVLRSVSRQVPQVAGERAPYFLSASVAELPPWNTAIDTGMDVSVLHSALPIMPERADEPWQPRFADGMEIRPDVDYFALTRGTERQQPQRLGRRQSMPVSQAAVSPTTLSPSKPVTGNALARRSTIRNSIRRRLRPGSASSATAPTLSPTKSGYHEIVIHGYGNGTNDVKLERRNTVGCDNSESGRFPPTFSPSPQRLPNIASPATEPEPAPAQRRHSSNRSSNASSIETMDSQGASGSASPATITTPEFEQNVVEPVIVRNSSHKSLTHRYPMKSVLETISRTASKRRGSLASSTAGGPEPPLPYASQQQPPVPAGLSRAASARKSLLPDSWTLGGRAATFEHDINEEDEVVTLQSEADEWIAMQALLDDDNDYDDLEMARKGATPGWEQYNDLGGLTEVR